MPTRQEERQHLIQADQHIVDGERRVAEQEIRTTEMDERGEATRAAREMLQWLDGTLVQWCQHQQAILDRIDRLSSGSA